MSHPYLHMLLARARTDDLYRDAAVARRAAENRRAAKPHRSGRARGHRRFRLAALDRSKPPPQPMVVAEVGGELRAALSLNDGSLVADPFYLTEGVADLLRAYARQVDVQPETRVSANSSGRSPDTLCAEGGLP